MYFYWVDINNTKYVDMKKQGKTDEEIEGEKESDQKMLILWRSIAITGIKNFLPPKMRTLLRFNTWEQAVRLVISRDFKGQ